MQIFEAEISDGIDKLIVSQKSVAINCELFVPKENIDSDAVQKAIAGRVGKGLEKDLYYFDSILASVGVNKNGDVFLPEEIWAARQTPIFKQVNYMHNEKDVIGVIFDSLLLDSNGKIISDESNVSNIKDIVTRAVLWSQWTDEDLQNRLTKIVSEIEAGRLYVSMECLFNEFDYMLTKGDETTIIKRNKDTAFLTKYLKAFGGDGVYKDALITRVLRKFLFSGKGIVENPANARSIISDNLCASCDDMEDDDDIEIETIDLEDSEESIDFSSIAEDNKNKKLNKPFRTPNGPKKFSVYVKNDKGNIVKVNFGDPNMSIKRDDPERRKAFRSRHNCDNPGPKWKARYWSCKFWSSPTVTKLLAENIMEKNELDVLKAELAKTQAELDNFKKTESEKISAQVSDLSTENENLKKQIADLTALAQKTKDDMEAMRKESEAEKKDMEAKCQEAEAKVLALENEKVLSDRKSQLVVAGVSVDKAEEVCKTWASASNDQFTEIVKLYSVNKPEESDPNKAEASNKYFEIPKDKGVNLNNLHQEDNDAERYKALAAKLASKFNFKSKNTKENGE